MSETQLIPAADDYDFELDIACSDSEGETRVMIAPELPEMPTIAQVRSALAAKKALDGDTIIQREWYRVLGEKNIRRNLDGLKAGTSFEIVFFEAPTKIRVSTPWVTSGRQWRG